MKFPVLLLSFVSGYSEGYIPRMGLRVLFVYHLVFLCKSCREKKGALHFSGTSTIVNKDSMIKRCYMYVT